MPATCDTYETASRQLESVHGEMLMPCEAVYMRDAECRVKRLHETLELAASKSPSRVNHSASSVCMHVAVLVIGGSEPYGSCIEFRPWLVHVVG